MTFASNLATGDVIDFVQILGNVLEQRQAVLKLQKALKAFGYQITPDGVYGAATQTVMRAFQLHFRSERVDGIADAECCARLLDLISRKQ